MRINCPYHDDKTPSMYCYEEFAHCFVCEAHVPVEEVLDGKEIQRIKKEPENIQEKISYIKNLPRINIRGCSFPSDELGYYITWPDNNYYKCRTHGKSTRYIGPNGHRAPIFNLGPNSASLVMVEGEINALSLEKGYSVRKFNIASPGSANEIMRHLPFYLTFDRISIIVDRDNAGVANGDALRRELIKHKKRVQLIACEKDINDILQTEGEEGVRKWAKENLDL